MNFLAPGMLLFGFLAIPIFMLYMLKLRRRDQVVPSTFLWQQILKDQHANAPWQKLKYQILLLVQLFILAALVLTMARPSLPVQTLASGPTIILLDGSASMLATDVAPNRFEVARVAAHLVIDGLPANIPVTLVLAGIQARVLVSNETNRGKINQALDEASASQGSADWKGAFSLAAGAVTRVTQARGSNNSTVIISDGGLPQEGLPALVGDVRYLPVGKSGENVGITAIAVRQSLGGLQLFTSVQNFGSQRRQVLLSCLGDGQLLQSRQIDLAPGSRQDILFENVPSGITLYAAKILPLPGGSARLDDFGLDDSASTIYLPVSGGRVLLLSAGNIFLKQLLEIMPGEKAYVMLAGTDKSIAIPTDPYDVYVLDGISPSGLPPGNLLLINPPQNEYFNLQGSFSETNDAQLADNPINHFVDWSNVHVSKAKKITVPSWAQTIVESKGGALVFAGETGGRRIAVVTFDLHDSDLPLQITFPVLFSNLMQYLSRSKSLTVISGTGVNPAGGVVDAVKEANLQALPGDRIEINPHEEVGSVQVTTPDGHNLPVLPLDGKIIFNQITQVGVYQATYPDHKEIAPDLFAVNLFSPEEENISPKESLMIGQKAVAARAETVTVQREYWPWLAGLALAVLILEWWMYQQQQGQRLGWLRK